MRCDNCQERAIISGPARCRKHFIEEFESRIQQTINEFSLIEPSMRIAVAASGGKDSLTVLSLLQKWYDDVTAICVDEGIRGYREHTIADLKRACAAWGVPLLLTSYKEYTGLTLDEILKRRRLHPCAVCGTFRRHLLSLASKPFDVLVTGHNMDDEVQTVLMNLLRGNTGILPRGGPKTGTAKAGFTQRVKPLYFVTEKEVMTYAYLHGFVTKFTECPNAPRGYRFLVREAFNEYVVRHPLSRERLLKRFLELKEHTPHEGRITTCTSCGEPSANETCKACEYLLMLNDQ